jgi:signal transduction histidine kinase
MHFSNIPMISKLFVLTGLGILLSLLIAWIDWRSAADAAAFSERTVRAGLIDARTAELKHLTELAIEIAKPRLVGAADEMARQQVSGCRETRSARVSPHILSNVTAKMSV